MNILTSYKTYISIVSFKSVFKSPQALRRCAAPQLPGTASRLEAQLEVGAASSLLPVPPAHSPLAASAVTARAKNSRRCCGRTAWLAAAGTEAATGASRARPAEGRIGLESKKIPSRQPPKGSGFGHCGSGRASTDSPAQPSLLFPGQVRCCLAGNTHRPGCSGYFCFV